MMKDKWIILILYMLIVCNMCKQSVLYSSFDVIEDINVKLYIHVPSVHWNQNVGNANLCQNSGFIIIFILFDFLTKTMKKMRSLF